MAEKSKNIKSFREFYKFALSLVNEKIKYETELKKVLFNINECKRQIELELLREKRLDKIISGKQKELDDHIFNYSIDGVYYKKNPLAKWNQK